MCIFLELQLSSFPSQLYFHGSSTNALASNGALALSRGWGCCEQRLGEGPWVKQRIGLDCLGVQVHLHNVWPGPAQSNAVPT
eukprot:1166430-Amphidinium_carterae.1